MTGQLALEKVLHIIREICIREMNICHNESHYAPEWLKDQPYQMWGCGATKILYIVDRSVKWYGYFWN